MASKVSAKGPTARQSGDVQYDRTASIDEMSNLGSCNDGVALGLAVCGLQARRSTDASTQDC